MVLLSRFRIQSHMKSVTILGSQPNGFEVALGCVCRWILIRVNEINELINKDGKL